MSIRLLDASIGGLCFAAIITQWLTRRRSKLPLPPGPDRLPLIGNLLQMPKNDAWVVYHEWCKKLGTDILHVDAAGTSLIILDTADVAYELLEKRSSHYSDRVHLTMIMDLIGWDFLLGFTPYGNLWRRRRRLMHQTFHPEAATKFYPYKLKATHGLLRRILNGSGPTDVLQELKQMSGETIMKSTYGLDVLERNDPFIEAADKAIESIAEAAVPGTFLVDAIPALKYVPEWVPGAGFQKKAKEWRKVAESMISLPFEAAKAKAQAGDEPYSFMSHAFQQKYPDGDVKTHEDDVQAATGTIYTAGMDTTVSVVSSTLLGLLEHPDVRAKAQQQIDEVIGTDRLPTFEDYHNLPYITAIVKEGLRWQTTVPIAIPHMASEEDEFNGYRIPKGAILIPNAWAMLHDPKHYPDPWDFKPDRFINREGELDTTVKDPDHAAFGFGRRICAGRYFALNAVWIVLASIIAVFDISKTVDENGKEIPLTHKYRTGLVNMPEPYSCMFRIRSKEAEALVKATTSQTYD